MPRNLKDFLPLPSWRGFLETYITYSMPKIKPYFPPIKARWFLLIPIFLETWVGILFGVAIGVVLHGDSPELVDALTSGIMSIALLFAGIFILFWARTELRKHGATFRAIFGPRPSFWQLICYGALTVCASFAGGASLIAVFYALYLFNPGFAKHVIEGAENSFAYSPGYLIANIVLTLLAAVIAPFFEELTFRGFVLQRWCSKWGYTTGIIATSLLFSALHFETMFGIVPLALVLAVTYIRTKSLSLVMAMHALNNILASGGMLLTLFDTGGEQYAFDSSTYFNDIHYVLIPGAVAGLIVDIYLFRAWPRQGELLPFEYNHQKLEEPDHESIPA